MAQKAVARSIHILSFTRTERDTLARVSIYIYIYIHIYINMHGARLCVCVLFVCEGVPLLLEPCDIIAFDLQINRESVHLLGGDGRCDGRAH